jgi:hypothetical protein
MSRASSNKSRRFVPWFLHRDRRSSRLCHSSNTRSTRFQEAEDLLRRQNARWRANSRRTQSTRQNIACCSSSVIPRILLGRSIPNRCISCAFPLVGGQQRNLACWIVHPIVVGRTENRQQSPSNLLCGQAADCTHCERNLSMALKRTVEIGQGRGLSGMP